MAWRRQRFGQKHKGIGTAATKKEAMRKLAPFGRWPSFIPAVSRNSLPGSIDERNARITKLM